MLINAIWCLSDPCDLEPGEVRPKEKTEQESPQKSKDPEPDGALNLVKSEVKEEANTDSVKTEAEKTLEKYTPEKKSSPEKSPLDKKPSPEKSSPGLKSSPEKVSPVKEENGSPKEVKESQEKEVKEETYGSDKDNDRKCETMETEESEVVKKETIEESLDKTVKEEKVDCSDIVKTEDGGEAMDTTPANEVDKKPSEDIKEEVSEKVTGIEDVKTDLPKEASKEKDESVGIKIENLLKAELGKQDPKAGNDSDSSIVCMDDHPLAPFRKYMMGTDMPADVSYVLR